MEKQMPSGPVVRYPGLEYNLSGANRAFGLSGSVTPTYFVLEHRREHAS